MRGVRRYIIPIEALNRTISSLTLLIMLTVNKLMRVKNFWSHESMNSKLPRPGWAIEYESIRAFSDNMFFYAAITFRNSLSIDPFNSST